MLSSFSLMWICVCVLSTDTLAFHINTFTLYKCTPTLAHTTQHSHIYTNTHIRMHTHTCTHMHTHTHMLQGSEHSVLDMHGKDMQPVLHMHSGGVGAWGPCDLPENLFFCV